MFDGIRAPEVLILLLLLVVLFGGKRLPEAARGLGRSLRIFKAELKSDEQDKTKPEDGDVK
ncbi:MAG: twin-arginine translocase TatA/TatE family subunit [Candidatus Nanopelagicales bacterium]